MGGTVVRITHVELDNGIEAEQLSVSMQHLFSLFPGSIVSLRKFVALREFSVEFENVLQYE